MHEVCLFCHRKNDISLVNSRIIRVINAVEQCGISSADLYSKGYANDYMWGIAAKCPYGMNCTKQDMGTAKMNAERAGMLLNAYIDRTDCKEYRNILRLLQGEFPAVYRGFERKALKKLGGEA